VVFYAGQLLRATIEKKREFRQFGVYTSDEVELIAAVGWKTQERKESHDLLNSDSQ
jgi:hypothetical protein